jgi:hypothetical protein
MAFWSTQPLTEMSTEKLPGGKERLVRETDNLTAIWADCLENVGASTSHNLLGLHGLLRAGFTLFIYLFIYASP